MVSKQKQYGSFAKQEMNKHGWSEGKGLGKVEDGMKEAIKVKMKNNKCGLGHDQGAEFTFHWWDHIFNKAANSFKVAENDGGVHIEKCEGKNISPILSSNKKPISSKYTNKSLLYGTFVKSGTYHNDNITKEFSDILTDVDSSDNSSDGEENCSIKDSLEKTFLKTGLTGHKGARHGLDLSGKLQRIREQEEKQLSSGKLNAKVDKDGYIACDDKVKERKKKKRKSLLEEVGDQKSQMEQYGGKSNITNNTNDEIISKLKKKKHKLKPDEYDIEEKSKNKKQKKRKLSKEEF